ncbi:hypothetical protein SRU_1279 [Salinibacter ruber DSM 13855]|uniref:Uncharacterized protein n=1 Tax=Salinibacter ruber (strain DSM 13855 / M31) TaxID=309807 RepID=Q2S328_SALRD|nr:hypothetical protein SRU_1279 [Salinibacter ruber DSM 13855]
MSVRVLRRSGRSWASAGRPSPPPHTTTTRTNSTYRRREERIMKAKRRRCERANGRRAGRAVLCGVSDGGATCYWKWAQGPFLRARGRRSVCAADPEGTLGAQRPLHAVHDPASVQPRDDPALRRAYLFDAPEVHPVALPNLSKPLIGLENRLPVHDGEQLCGLDVQAIVLVGRHLFEDEGVERIDFRRGVGHDRGREGRAGLHFRHGQPFGPFSLVGRCGGGQIRSGAVDGFHFHVERDEDVHRRASTLLVGLAFFEVVQVQALDAVKRAVVLDRPHKLVQIGEVGLPLRAEGVHAVAVPCLRAGRRHVEPLKSRLRQLGEVGHDVRRRDGRGNHLVPGSPPAANRSEARFGVGPIRPERPNFFLILLLRLNLLLQRRNRVLLVEIREVRARPAHEDQAGEEQNLIGVGPEHASST